jgi:parallel beta-helix repeat protein
MTNGGVMKRSLISSISFTALYFVGIYSTANAANLYVNASGSGADCIRVDPCPTIQMAVDKAGTGDTILIASGTYTENVRILPGKNGLTVTGEGADNTVVVSAGGVEGVNAPGPADIIFDILSPDVTIEKLSIEHPAEMPTKRDLGFFVRPPATNVTIQKCRIVRSRIGDVLEPVAPGSRGVFVLQAGGTVISKNTFRGNYEDHIHLPTHDAEISKNDVSGATRLGIVIIQENDTTNNNNNTITKNTVANSGSDGIQIQSDDNLVAKNTIHNNGGAAIKLCGVNVVGDCVNPFDTWSEASNNSVTKNKYSNNGIDGVVDNGTDNVINEK